VRDDENAFAVVAGGELPDRLYDALAQLLVRLAVVPALLAGDPARVRVREALLGLRSGQAGPGADVDFAELRKLADGQAARLGDDLRRLEGSGEVARVDGVELEVGKPLGELPGLLASPLRERPVRVPLPAPGPVPVAFAVCRVVPGGSWSRRYATRPWILAFATVSVS
jgi:hypothetical protein